MSRIGQKPVDVPAGVKVGVQGSSLTVKGAQGELHHELPSGISAEVAGAQVVLKRDSASRDRKSLHGLTRTIVANMMEGVTKGFSKELDIEGVGFRASIQGKTLSLALGFASPVQYAIPTGVTVTEQGGTHLVVAGPDKQQVGNVAAHIRSYFPAEPYKGKGLRYKGEYVRRKVGKTVA